MGRAISMSSDEGSMGLWAAGCESVVVFCLRNVSIRALLYCSWPLSLEQNFKEIPLLWLWSVCRINSSRELLHCSWLLYVEQYFIEETTLLWMRSVCRTSYRGDSLITWLTTVCTTTKNNSPTMTEVCLQKECITRTPPLKLGTVCRTKTIIKGTPLLWLTSVCRTNSSKELLHFT